MQLIRNFQFLLVLHRENMGICFRWCTERSGTVHQRAHIWVGWHGLNTWPLIFDFLLWRFTAKRTLSLRLLHSERRSTIADHRVIVFPIMLGSEDAGVFFAGLSQCIPIRIARGLNMKWLWIRHSRRLSLLLTPNLKFLFLSQFSLLLEIHFLKKFFYYFNQKISCI